ncbi:transposase [Streptomyces sp. SRF1]|uniref:transposase n=1 Tax=Streptomyces sp. SRF1 TaxID=1549642 RepID=UPI00339D4AD3
MMYKPVHLIWHSSVSTWSEFGWIDQSLSRGSSSWSAGRCRSGAVCARAGVAVASRSRRDRTGPGRPKLSVHTRKRGLAVDVLGLVIAVVVLAANVHDNTAGITLLSEVAVNAGGNVSKALADQGFKTQVVTHGAGLGIDVEIAQRDPQHQGFVPQPKRWRVEQTCGILILHRRLVRDYEHRPSSSTSRVYWAITHVIVRRLTGANVPTWREAAVAA